MHIFFRTGKEYKAGEVYYYKSMRKTYAAVFLYKQDDYYLIALSEEIGILPKKISVEEVLNTQLYTVSWFSDLELLPSYRLHYIGTVQIEDDYQNRAGMYEQENGSIILKNCGQSWTWKHKFQAFRLKDTVVREILTTKYIPESQPPVEDF